MFAKKNKHTKIKSNAIAVCLYGYFVDVGGRTDFPPFKIKKASNSTYSLSDYPKVVIKNKGNGQRLVDCQICSMLPHILQQDMCLATYCAANFLKFVNKVASEY